MVSSIPTHMIRSIPNHIIQSAIDARLRAEGKATAVVEVLEMGSVPVSDAVRTEILECTDPDVLDEWSHRAIGAILGENPFP